MWFGMWPLRPFSCFFPISTSPLLTSLPTSTTTSFLESYSTPIHVCVILTLFLFLLSFTSAFGLSVLAWRLLHILGVGPNVSYPNAEPAFNDGQFISATYCSVYIFTILLYNNWDSVVTTQPTTNRPAYKLTRHWKQVGLKAKKDQDSVSISAESMFSVYSHRPITRIGKTDGPNYRWQGMSSPRLQENHTGSIHASASITGCWSLLSMFFGSTVRQHCPWYSLQIDGSLSSSHYTTSPRWWLQHFSPKVGGIIWRGRA